MKERIIKPWGWSEEIYRDKLSRVVRIEVVPGGYCSSHYHALQDNIFYLLNGSLLIKHDHELSRINNNNRYITVRKMTVHHFVNDTSDVVEAIEIYNCSNGSEPDENDIIRLSHGGVVVF